MLRWIIAGLFAAAIVSGLIGFDNGLAGKSELAQNIFYVAMVLLAFALIFAFVKGPRPGSHGRG